MGIPRQKWTEEEEDALRAGVAKHGTGKWKNIQQDPHFNPLLYSRSNIDLKDKWRNMSVGGNGQGPTEKARTPKPKPKGADSPATPMPISQVPCSSSVAIVPVAIVPADPVPTDVIMEDSSKCLLDGKTASKINGGIQVSVQMAKGPREKARTPKPKGADSPATPMPISQVPGSSSVAIVPADPVPTDIIMEDSSKCLLDGKTASKVNGTAMGNPKQKWTQEEEDALRAGVAKHGTGKWKNIQKDPEFNPHLYSRSNIDLKDKWRNMSVGANDQGPREKARTPKPKGADSPATPMPISQVPGSSSVAIVPANPVPTDVIMEDSSKCLLDGKTASKQSDTKNDETVNNNNVETKKDETVKKGKGGPKKERVKQSKVGAKKDKEAKKEDKVPKSPTSDSSSDASTEANSVRKRARCPRPTKADSSDQEIDELVGPSAFAIIDDDASVETVVSVWKSAISGVGQEFSDVYEFREALQRYAMANGFGYKLFKKKKKNGFEYKLKKNDTDRASGVCTGEGCSWKFNAVWVPTTQSFKIKTMNNVHTCDLESRVNSLVITLNEKLQESPHLQPKEIANQLLLNEKLQKSPRLKPKKITNQLLKDSGVDLKRGTMVVRDERLGSDKESYNLLPWFCDKIIETNPGSISKLIVGENKRFKALFVSFYASLYGFQNSCRPLLFFESTSLRSMYGEVLLTANAIDGNDDFFPVAFAIVDVEDDDNWRWFLEQLKAAILYSQPMTFVFDMEKNLKTSVFEVFQDAHVGYSIYHLLESFKRNVKGPFQGDGKSFLPVYFLAAAHAVRLVGFRKSIEQIKLISSQAYDWVMQIEPQHWAASSFKGERYNHITDDVGGSLAKLMEDYQESSILQKIDALIRTMIDAITDAKLDACMWMTHLTPSKEKQLQEESLRSCGLKVLISSDTLFEVREESTHVVNIGDWSCTCLGWKETGLPCRHSLAVFALIGRNPYEYCANYFTVDAYRLTYLESINQVPIEMEEGEKFEVRKPGVEKGQGLATVGENEGGEKIEVEEENGEKIEMKIAGDENEGKTNGDNDHAEKEDREKTEAEDEHIDIEVDEAGGKKEESMKVGGENEAAAKVENEKMEVEKDGGVKGKISETDDDPNVLVLPPIPVKPAVVKENMEWEEKEVETTKRTVTCTKCKQTGHNKKSCNFYQAQQAGELTFVN